MPPQPADPRMRALGALLKRLREETGRSQSEFAERFGVTIDTLQNWEHGRRQPTGLILLDLIHALEVPARRWGDVLSPLLEKAQAEKRGRAEDAAEPKPAGKKPAKKPKKKGGKDS